MRITNFASGELSRNLRGRVDIPQYYQGAQRIENFDIIPTGGIKRRPGTERLGQLHQQARLIPFIVDKNNSFILEIFPEMIYFWKNGRPYLDNNDQQIYEPNPWTSLAEINEIHYAQNFDTLIFVQRNHPPQILTYSMEFQTFSMGPMTFDFFPDVQLDDDYDYIKVVESGNLPTPEFDGQYCIYKGKLYKWSDEDAKWNEEGTDPETDTELFAKENKYPGAVAFFNSRLFLGSTNEKRQKIWASATPDTEGTRYNEFSTFQKYVTVTRGIKEPDLHVFTGNIALEDIDRINNTTRITNLTQDFTEEGILAENITAYFIANSSIIPLGTKVLEVTPKTMTINCALEADKDLEAIVFTIALWRNPESASADDYELSVTQQNITTADCSFNFELASDQNDNVVFMASNISLIVGTESSVWYCPSGINALNVQAVFNGSYGSDELQGHCVGNATIYFAQGKCGIREHYYDSQAEAFRTNNIALLADQMLEESPAVDFDFMTNPYHRLIVTREDGIAAVMLYDKTNGIMAWSRLLHGNGKIKSIAVTRGDASSDIVYLCIEDNGQFYLERIDPSKHVYLDSWQKFKADEIYGEESILYNQTTDEFIPLRELSEHENFIHEDDLVYVGYIYESLISSMPVLTNDPTGKKRITRLLVRFVDSYMPEMHVADLPPERFDGEKYSGIKPLTYPGSSDRDVDFTITMKEPRECNILAVNAETA